MFLILISWGLDWGGLRKWEQNAQILQKVLDSVQSAYQAADTINIIKLEAAVTRFISKKSPDPVLRFMGDYADSWKSPDVRYAWFQIFYNELKTIKARLRILKSLNAIQSLNIYQDIHLIETNIHDVQSELSTKLNINSLDGKVFLKPDFDLMTGREANIIGDKLNPINQKLLELIDIFGNKEFGKNRNVFSGSYHQNIDGKPYFRKCLVNKSMDDLSGRQSYYSNIYKIVFIFGSILLIFVKLLDWYWSLFKST